MKTTWLYIIGFFFVLMSNAQILELPVVTQEETEWCWVGVSKSILDYYGNTVSQCEIAEYARQEITWHDFGDTNCCDDTTQGCNYWNYNWGPSGSIQDILIYFDNIQNYGYADPLSLAEIVSEIAAGRPFVVRWGWDFGGGHFVVGHGVNGGDISYMDPWFGEGYHISTYDWLVSGGSHTWTHTNVLTTSLSSVEIFMEETPLKIYPNPSKSILNVTVSNTIEKVKIFSASGVLVYTDIPKSNRTSIHIDRLTSGVYVIGIRLEERILYRTFLKE